MTTWQIVCARVYWNCESNEYVILLTQKGKSPLREMLLLSWGIFLPWRALPPTEVSIKPLADVDADYICCDGLEYNEYVTHRWHPLSPSGMQDGRSSIPFFDRFRNLFSCIKSAKMMPQQLDKVWSLGYTKTAKALSKTLLDASHSAKIPRWEAGTLSRGIFALRQALPPVHPAIKPFADIVPDHTSCDGDDKIEQNAHSTHPLPCRGIQRQK